MTTAMVVGLGAAGRRHARILKGSLPDVRVVGVSRTTEPVPHVDLVVPAIEQALQEAPSIGVIAGPAADRVAAALRLAGAGVHLLLEKPVAVDLSGVADLHQLARDQGLTIAVGYNLRFFPPLLTTRDFIVDDAIGVLRGARVEVGQYLPDWRPGTDHRRSVSARRDLGGGALLELSHEIDYVRWIMGQPASVWATLAHLGLRDLDVEDTAELVITMECGALASLHLDMLQRPAVRTARFVGERGSIVTDLLRGTVTIHERDQEPRQVGDPSAAEVDLTYVAQMEDFLAAIESSRPPRVPLEEGIATLELALGARRSAAQGCAVAIASDPASVRP